MAGSRWPFAFILARKLLLLIHSAVC